MGVIATVTEKEIHTAVCQVVHLEVGAPDVHIPKIEDLRRAWRKYVCRARFRGISTYSDINQVFH